MYRYRDTDQRLIEARAAEFRDQVERRLRGELAEADFKALRLQNGLYLQLHAYMLRVAIPYGALSSEQLRCLAAVARRWDRGYGHLTTRQNIQFNWIRLIDMPDILDALADSQLHAVQTSGNCVRNVTSDPYAGAAADERIDPRPWAELIRQWSTFHPEFAHLPRKFKIAVSGSEEDRAAVKFHDIGLYLRGAPEDVRVDVWVGGGQGRTPRVARLLREGLPGGELLPYLESILRVYNLAGRRDNKYKARIKILVDALGVEALRAQVDEDYQALAPHSAWGGEGQRERLDAIRERFDDPRLIARAPAEPLLRTTGEHDPGFARWLPRAGRAHRVAGHRSVLVSVKPAGGVPGDLSADQMDGLAALAERFAFSQLRFTIEQNLVLPHVAEEDLPALYRGLQALGLARANQGLISDIVACPGLDYCNLATTRSIPIAQAIDAHISGLGLDEEVGPLALKISGCVNACGHHHVGAIGVLGVDRKGEEYYQLTLGGAPGEEAAIGEKLGRALPAREVPAAVERMLRYYLNAREEGEAFATLARRVGGGPFRAALEARAGAAH